MAACFAPSLSVSGKSFLFSLRFAVQGFHFPIYAYSLDSAFVSSDRVGRTFSLVIIACKVALKSSGNG